MSYEEFRRRIDTARQILVGAVPSPAGQIDQITYALMYKFMNDIDDESAALGGKRSYFVGEYAKFNWHELMSTQLGAHERLELYREAIQTMAKNENLPELFRSIYQNAFLPFNSANVLTLFLKEIDKFSHGESDDIGDAYEYLLSITGAQGDVGQFRTPRHIIKFIVEAVNPTKDDKVLDPAVGTAGFLIAAYNHVRSQHDGKDDSGERNDEKRLTADELHKIHHNYRGFDIDPTMVRTAKINMYLHGFKTPDIINHDSLSSEEYWNDWYDVILANPPFMTPKGGIQPHKKFGISANRAEVLFVDYIASHLKPNGRAGIVVPEGIIFQSGKAYKELRKNLVENSLYAVVSLPAGVFNPYAGVKTSVLLLDKELAKQNDEILFVKIEKDGFSLGAQRSKLCEDYGKHPNLCPIHSDLPHALQDLDLFKEGKELQTEFAHSVPRNEIAQSGDYNLNGDRYKLPTIVARGDYEHIRVGDLITENQKSTIKVGDAKASSGSIIFFTSGASQLGYDHSLVDGENLFLPTGGNAYVFYHNGEAAYSTDTWSLKSSDESSMATRYLYYVLNSQREHINTAMFKGAGLKHLDKHILRDFKIPLPPIEIQREIVAELDGYQKIIDAAQAIVQTYKPTIKINPGWKTATLPEVAEINKSSVEPVKHFGDTSFTYIDVSSVENNATGVIDMNNEINTKDAPSRARRVIGVGDTLISTVRPNLRAFAYVRSLPDKSLASTGFAILTPKINRIMPEYLYYSVTMDAYVDQLVAKMGKGAYPSVNTNDLNQSHIPLPPIEIQREIVAELEAEQKLVDANKKLIEIYQQKIKSKIAEVWGE